MQLSYMLGIETATRNCSVAIVSKKKVLAEHNANTGNNHEPHLMTLVEKALSDCNLKLADISGIAVSTGPGSFTGLRIGIATAKGLALASGKPVVGIPTLDGLSCNVASIPSGKNLCESRNSQSRVAATVCPLLEAYRGEAYGALYKYSGEFVFQKMTPYMVLPLEELLEKITEKTIFLGDINREIIEKRLGDKAVFGPSELNQAKATSIAYLGILHSTGVPRPQTFEPKAIYLRKARAEEEPPVTLDEMREEDIPRVMEIEREAFPSPWSETMFKDRDRAISLVARLKERIIGYVVGLFMVDELHLGNIAVHRDFRSRGIAKKLLQRVMEIARSKNIKVITLEVRAGNVAAQNLYRKFGFKTAGRKKEYYQDRREDAVIMTLKLLNK